jgi:hypothetical protein
MYGTDRCSSWTPSTADAEACHLINQSHLFMKPFSHQLMSQSAIQKPSLKHETASNADVEAHWLGKNP